MTAWRTEAGQGFYVKKARRGRSFGEPLFTPASGEERNADACWPIVSPHFHQFKSIKAGAQNRHTGWLVCG
jgi:hypothetical protein